MSFGPAVPAAPCPGGRENLVAQAAQAAAQQPAYTREDLAALKAASTRAPPPPPPPASSSSAEADAADVAAKFSGLHTSTGRRAAGGSRAGYGRGLRPPGVARPLLHRRQHPGPDDGAGGEEEAPDAARDGGRPRRLGQRRLYPALRRQGTPGVTRPGAAALPTLTAVCRTYAAPWHRRKRQRGESPASCGKRTRSAKATRPLKSTRATGSALACAPASTRRSARRPSRATCAKGTLRAWA